MKIAITGSHGLIGTAVGQALTDRGDEVIPVVRSAPRSGEVGWNPHEGTIDAASLEGIDAVVHLAGEGIAARRWNAAHKARVLDSRVRGTRLIADAIASLDAPPKVLISGAAIGYYGDRGGEVLTEDSGAGLDFLAHVVDRWEKSTEPAEAAGIRVVTIRTSLVLTKKGGILPRMILPFRLFVGGRLGRGDQYMSWISLADEIGAILHLLDSDVTGPVNLCTPEPVTNRDFARIISKVMRRPGFFAVPSIALKLVLGSEMADSTVLVSQRVLPARLEASGYTYKDPHLAEFLAGELA